jgi:hypothetical protein
MPIVNWIGYVEPRNLKFYVENLAPIEEKDLLTDLKMSFTVSILEGIVGIECDVSDFRKEDMSALTNRALEIVRTFIDLYSFSSGYGLNVYLEKFICPDGSEVVIMPKNHPLAALCTAYTTQDMNEMFSLIVHDASKFMALNDLVTANNIPRHAEINCSRAMDAIRKLISPNLNDIQGWRAMQKALNVDEKYLKYISEISKDARHGKREWYASQPMETNLQRAWTVMDRYLSYLKRGEVPLPLDEFPLKED